MNIYESASKKNLSVLLITGLFLTVWVSGAFGQTKPKERKPSFDANLAKKLGADERGMKNYVFVILKTGPNDKTVTGKEREEAFKGHFANMTKLADEGKLAVAGPFGQNDRTYRGLLIFNVANIEEAQKLVEGDPTVVKGIFIVEMTPWYGSASLMATPEIHKKIAKTNP